MLVVLEGGGLMCVKVKNSKGLGKRAEHGLATHLAQLKPQDGGL